jgi:hypothetical protein
MHIGFPNSGDTEQQNVEPGFAKQRLRHGKQGMSNVEVMARAVRSFEILRFYCSRFCGSLLLADAVPGANLLPSLARGWSKIYG